MKLKKIIKIFLSKISNFFNVLKLNNAYREKTTEKKFSEGAPKIIKIGKINNKNFRNISIWLLTLDNIILT